MGVELQHAVVFGFIVDVDERRTEPMDDEDDVYLGYPDKDPSRGDLVTLTPNYGSSDVLVVGILEFITDSVRWNGPQTLPLRRLTDPDDAEIRALKEVVDEMPVTRRDTYPEHITLTYKW